MKAVIVCFVHNNKTVAFAAFIITRSWSSLRFFRAFNSALVMLLCGGGRALWSREAEVVHMASFESSGRQTMVASETISLTGIVRGVGANLGPLSRRERSAAESGFWDKLIAQFCLLIVVGWSSTASKLRLLNLFSCSQASFTFLSSSFFHACFYSQFFAPHSYIFSLARHIFHSLKAID